MKTPQIHVCWVDRITRDLKLPDRPTTENPNLVRNSNLDGDKPNRKCFDTFQSLKVRNIPKVPAATQE